MNAKLKRQTLIPAGVGGGRQSMAPRQPHQQAVSAAVASLQSAMDYYLPQGLSTMQVMSPFQHLAAVQTVMERIVYENIFNQNDVGYVLSSFNIDECVQNVARDMGIEDFNSVGRLHHEFLRGFLVAACIDYALQPLRAVIVSVPITDWFSITEPPGSLMNKPQIEKYKSTYNDVSKLNARIRELLDNSMLLLMWFSSIYAVLQEELEAKFNERDIMHAIQQETAALRSEKLQLEEEFERDKAEIVEAERRKSELHEMCRKSSEKSEQVGKVLGSGHAQTAEAQENLRALTVQLERARRKQRDIEMLVVKNPAELQASLRSAQEALRKSQASKNHKQQEIVEANQNIEALANYANDLRCATTLADKVFNSVSAENIRKQRYNIERELNMLKTEFDSLCRTVDVACMQEDVLRLDVVKQNEQDQQLVDEIMSASNEQQAMLSKLQTQVDELRNVNQVREAMLQLFDDRIRLENQKTKILEFGLRENLQALQDDLDDVQGQWYRRNGLE